MSKLCKFKILLYNMINQTDVEVLMATLNTLKAAK